jgi:hypothetical protein
MSNLYDEDDYVVLRPGQDEQFFTRAELEELLCRVIAEQEHLEGMALRERVKHLIDTVCEYRSGPGDYLEWYATRLEKD